MSERNPIDEIIFIRDFFSLEIRDLAELLRLNYVELNLELTKGINLNLDNNYVSRIYNFIIENKEVLSSLSFEDLTKPLVLKYGTISVYDAIKYDIDPEKMLKVLLENGK